MSIRTQETRKKAETTEPESPDKDVKLEESPSSEDFSSKEFETGWINTKDSILGDKPYILPNGEVYKKRVRTVMTPMQSELLKRYFRINSFPTAETRAAISTTLGMKPRTVQIWFQNQRQKMKQIIQEEEKIRTQRLEESQFGEKGEETLWVLAHISCVLANAQNQK